MIMIHDEAGIAMRDHAPAALPSHAMQTVRMVSEVARQRDGLAPDREAPVSDPVGVGDEREASAIEGG
jgi:hypothetical protein